VNNKLLTSIGLNDFYGWNLYYNQQESKVESAIEETCVIIPMYDELSNRNVFYVYGNGYSSILNSTGGLLGGKLIRDQMFIL
jgi:hypothetical protein